ncbi:GDP-mannose 4,6-dehydratase [Candidatus Curtissbacteria bacterium]|nr:GDP-mannose 4,6-dehydratase [Candidatus Curtissbacteria bacterium]
MKTILITGCAGFIGSNLADRLLSRDYRVVGVDDFNNYYDPKLKKANIKEASRNKNFKMFIASVLENVTLQDVFVSEKPDIVIHLAARAGVRPSINNPLLYGEVNVLGTVNLLKLSVENNIEKFILASSSSVYGNSPSVPFDEADPCVDIASPYGASKRSAEFFTESFNKNFHLKCAILRFFTVYGPRGRVDMAPAILTKSIIENREFEQFGDGSTSRDYTYIDDIVDGILKAIEWPGEFEIFNLGSDNPVLLKDFIQTVEDVTGKKAIVKIGGPQMGDVERTWANIVKARRVLGWKSRTQLKEGLTNYFQWLRNQT